MADFDPDAYLRSTPPGVPPGVPRAAFDPDKYLATGSTPVGDWYSSLVGGLEAARNTLDPATTGVIRGIPIAGPALDAAAKYAAAGGDPNRYRQLTLENEQRQAEHPVSNAVGLLTGGLVGGVPVMRAFPTLMGGNSFLGQTAASAGLGAADAASRSALSSQGFNPSDVYWGAGIGAAAPAIGSVLAPIGQGIGWMGRTFSDLPGVSSFSGRLRVPAAPGPGEVDVLEKAANTGYNQLNSLFKYDRTDLNTLAQTIKDDLYHGATNPASGVSSPKSAQLGAVATHDILDRLNSLPATPGALHTTRKALNDVVSKGGDEGASAAFARDAIDQFLERPPPGSIIYHNPANPQNANALQILQDANANWRTMKNSAEYNQLRANAAQEAASANMLAPALVEGQILRRMTKDYLKPTRSPFLEGDARQAVSDVASPQSFGQGLLDTLGKASGTARIGPITSIPGALATFGPLLHSGSFEPMTTAGLMLGGAGANLASTGMTRMAAQRASDAIRAQAPYAQQEMQRKFLGPPGAPVNPLAPPPGVLPNSLNPYQHRNEITRLMMLQAEQQRQAMGGP